MLRYYHLPDGTDTDIRPEEDQILKVSEGDKTTTYQWDEDSEEWEILPEVYTDPEIIERSKEIMKIGKYYDQRPAKKRYWHEMDEYDMYPYGMAMLYGTYPYAGPALASGSAVEGDESVNEQYNELLDNVRARHYKGANSHNDEFPNQNKEEIPSIHPMVIDCTRTERGSYVPCTCGAIHTEDMDSHSVSCRRHVKNYGRHY